MEQLVESMQEDEIQTAALANPYQLVRREIGMRISALQHKVDQKQDDIYGVSQSVKMLGRNLLQASKTKPGISLTDLLESNNFDLVVNIARGMSTEKDDPVAHALNVGRTIAFLIQKV